MPLSKERMRDRKRQDRSNLVKPNIVKPTVSGLIMDENRILDVVSPSVRREGYGKASSTVKPVSNPKRKRRDQMTAEELGIIGHDADGNPLYEE